MMKAFSGALLALMLIMCACAKSEAEEGASPTPDASVGASGPASAPLWTVDAAASRLGFSAVQNNKRFEGVFEKFDAAILFDPDNLGASSIEVTVHMKTAKTGDRQRDRALPGGDWFKVKDYPVARFVSQKLSRTGEGAYEAAGALTIRDMTKDIVLPFTLAIDGDTAKANGALTLIRTDFGVGQGEDFSHGTWVGLEVNVMVDITAAQ